MEKPIDLYEHVTLNDGREGAVVELLGDDTLLIDIGSSPADWETIEVKRKDIVANPD